MSDARLKGIMVNKSDIDSVNIKTGQMLLCLDTKELFFDKSSDDRLKISDVIWLASDENRLSIANPITNKLYIISSTGKIWLYSNNTWVDLVSSITGVTDEIGENNNNPISSSAVYNIINEIKTNYALKSKSFQITIEKTSWTAYGDKYTYTATGLTGVTSTSNVIVGLHPTYISASEFNIICISQDTESLTFNADILPDSNVVINVMMID